MHVPFSWQRIVWRVALVYSPLFVLGLLTDHLLLCCLFAAVSHIIWLYSQQYKLVHWLYHQRKLSPPQGRGSWEPVFYGIYNMLKRRLARERELARLMKYFRLGAEALPDAIVVINQDGAIIWCNQLATDMLKLQWPADTGQYLTNLIRTPIFIDYLIQDDFSEPLEMESPVNPNILLEFRVMPYSQQQLMLVVRDITQLRQLEKMRKQFVSNVSHELRTPLTVIRGYLEMLDPDQPESMIWPKARSTMLSQSERMDNLINQLLTLAKIESSSAELSQQPIDLTAMLMGLEAEAESLAKNAQLKIEFSIQAQGKILGDASQLRSACTNLLSNAIKYCEQPGTISVSWQAVDKGLRFSVSDSGPGIEAYHLARLTERFYRIDKARSRDTGGAGLGLSIVKHALQHHDCELKITSRLGKGSCFSFTIPKHLVLESSP